MSAHDHAAPESVPFAGEALDRYRHVCAFVNSREEEHRILDPFVTEGVERGEKLVYFVDGEDRANLVRHFRRLGLDMPDLLERERFEVRAWAETYLRNGQFDQDAMLALLDELLGGAGSTRIRLVAEMGWAAGQPDVSERLVEFEARANFVQAKYDHVVICVYDVAKFGGDVVIDMLRTHPFVLIGGALQANPFFVPPADFLNELRSRDRRAADA
jgi:hypothetical protein